MTAVTSFRIVYVISLAFGIFPYAHQNLNSFYVSEPLLRRAKSLFWILLVVRVIIIGSDIKSNEFKVLRSLSVIVRAENTLILEILAILVYKNVFKRSHSICSWLNQVTLIHSSLTSDSQNLINYNYLIALYSLGFYSVINLPMYAILLLNGKFISGAVASFDSVTFVFLLLIQNVYLVQLMAFLNLARSCFSSINDVTRNEFSPEEKPRELLRKLKKLRTYHMEATDFYSFINSAFEFYIFFYIAWSFQSIIVCSVVLVMFDFVDCVTLYLWLWYHLFQNLPLLSVCEWVSMEAKKSINCVQELIFQDIDLEIKEEVEIFSLQLQHRPVEFNVCGFFTLNCKLFVTVAGIIVTYVIALIQTQSMALPHQTNATNYL